MSSIPEDLDFLPNGPQGDVLVHLNEETISLSSFDTRVSFAVYLNDDSFPTKTYGYHFTDAEEQGSIFGREIENEFSEIYWHFSKKCIVMDGEIVAKTFANLTINSPCFLINKAHFINFDKVTFFHKELLDLGTQAPVYGEILSSKGILFNLGGDSNIRTDKISIEHTGLYVLGINMVNYFYFNNGTINHYGVLNINNGGEIKNTESYTVYPNAQILSGDYFLVRSTLFSYGGYLSISGVLSITSNTTRLLNETGIGVGSFSLETLNFENKGDITAVSGNLTIRILYDSDFVNLYNLSAKTLININTTNNFKNDGMLSSETLSVTANSFTNNYFIYTENYANFTLSDFWQNNVAAEVDVGGLVISKKKLSKIDTIDNYGKIYINNLSSSFYSINLNVLSTGLNKSLKIIVQEGEEPYNYDRRKDRILCKKHMQEEKRAPVIASFISTADMMFNVSKIQLSSAKIYTSSKIFFQDTSITKSNHQLLQWGRCDYGKYRWCPDMRDRAREFITLGKLGTPIDDPNYPTCCVQYNDNGELCIMSSEESPSIYYEYPSVLYAVKGISGALAGLELVNSVPESLAIADSNNALVLARDAIGAKVSNIIMHLSNLAIQGNHGVLDGNEYFRLLFPQQINQRFFGYNDPSLLLPGGSGLIALYNTRVYKNPLFDLASIIEQYLSLGLDYQGYVFTIGDSHFLEHLIQDEVFRNIGIIAGIDNTRLAETLINNGLQEFMRLKPEGKYPDMGIALTKDQVDKLERLIIHFVKVTHEKDNREVLYPVLYWNEKCVEEFISDSGIYSESEVDLTVNGNVVLDGTSQIRAKKNIRLAISGDSAIFGTITSSDVVITSGSTYSTYIGQNGGLIGTNTLSYKGENGILINLGTIQGNTDIEIKGGDFYNYGGVIFKGETYIRARNIMEDALSDGCKIVQVPTYIGVGNLYRGATEGISERAVQKTVDGNIYGVARNIQKESVHETYLVITYHKKSYSVETRSREYSNTEIASGTVIYEASDTYENNGARISAEKGGRLLGQKATIFKAKTTIGQNHYYAKKTKMFSSTSISVDWTNHFTSLPEVSSLEGYAFEIGDGSICSFESMIAPNKIKLSCAETEFKSHVVESHYHATTTKRGLVATNVPLRDIVMADRPERELVNTIGITSAIKQTTKMKGVGDLAGVTRLMSETYALKKGYEEFARRGLSGEMSLLSSLASSLVSAKGTFGVKRTIQDRYTRQHYPVMMNSVEGTLGDTKMTYTQINRVQLRINGDLLVDRAVDIDTFKQITRQTGVDLSISLTGVGIGGSYSKSKPQQTTVINRPSILGNPNTNSTLFVTGSITLIGSKITGKRTEVSAASLKEVEVLDQYETKTSSTGLSVGATVTWGGEICPYGSVSRFTSNDAETLKVDASITGEELILNISNRERVTVTEHKTHKASSIAAGASVNVDGSFNPFVSGSKEDGKKRYSIYVDRNLFRGLDEGFLPTTPVENKNTRTNKEWVNPDKQNDRTSGCDSIVCKDRRIPPYKAGMAPVREEQQDLPVQFVFDEDNSKMCTPEENEEGGQTRFVWDEDGKPQLEGTEAGSQCLLSSANDNGQCAVNVYEWINPDKPGTGFLDTNSNNKPKIGYSDVEKLVDSKLKSLNSRVEKSLNSRVEKSLNSRVEKEIIDSYKRYIYKMYLQNGKVDASLGGFLAHRSGYYITLIGDAVPYSAKLGKVIDCIGEVLGEVMMKGIQGIDEMSVWWATGSHSDLVEMFPELATNNPYDFHSNARDARNQAILKEVITPIVQELYSYYSDFSPEQKAFLKFLERASIVVPFARPTIKGAVGAAKAIPKVASATVSVTNKAFKATAKSASKMREVTATGLRKVGKNVATTIESGKCAAVNIFEHPITPAPAFVFVENRRPSVSPTQKSTSLMEDIFNPVSKPPLPSGTTLREAKGGVSKKSGSISKLAEDDIISNKKYVVAIDIDVQRVLSSITEDKRAALDSLNKVKVTSPVLKVEESQLFKQYFEGKPIKLELHEGRAHNGHTLSEHVSKGDLKQDVQFLVDRRVKEDLKISSMYPSKEIAEKVTNEVLLHNEAAILKWFKNKRDNSGIPFYMEFKDKIGYGVTKGNNKLEFFNIARVYLRKKGESIKIETSFPVREAKR